MTRMDDLGEELMIKFVKPLDTGMWFVDVRL